MTLREQAEEAVLDEYCQATCKGMGRCCDPQQCEGYRREVEYTLEQWTTDENKDDKKRQDAKTKSVGMVFKVLSIARCLKLLPDKRY